MNFFFLAWTVPCFEVNCNYLALYITCLESYKPPRSPWFIWDQGLKVTAVSSPASIREINLPRDVSLGRSESQGWILLLVTQSYKNCKKGRKNKAGLDWRASSLLLWDWNRAFGTFEQNVYALCRKAEPCPSAGYARHWSKLVKLIAITKLCLGKSTEHPLVALPL